MMGKKVYCTYCSRKKREDPVLLEAINRYDSDRIRSLYQTAQNDGHEFLILSGEYGLLRPADKIPYYDHLLKQEEVGDLIERVSVQLHGMGISDLVYYTEPWQGDPATRPYFDTIAAACKRLDIALTIRALSQKQK